MTGIGRTGKMFAIEHWGGVEPDVIALGKGMSAGYTPMAATLVREEIVRVIEQGSGVIMSGHTYSANPLSAAFLAVLEYVLKHDLANQAASQGDYLKQKLEELKKQSSIIGDVRGLGLLLGIELVADKQSKQPFPLGRRITARLIQKAFAHGLLVYSAMGGIDGQAGDAVLIAPPLTITTAEIDELIELLTASVQELEAELQAEQTG